MILGDGSARVIPGRAAGEIRRRSVGRRRYRLGPAMGDRGPHTPSNGGGYTTSPGAARYNGIRLGGYRRGESHFVAVLPMRLPRVRLRTLMIAVAVAAVAIYGTILWERQMTYLALAREKAQLANLYARQFEGQMRLASEVTRPDSPNFLESVGRPEQLRDSFLESAGRSGRLRDFYHRLEATYRRGASRPWLKVPPAPPQPE